MDFTILEKYRIATDTKWDAFYPAIGLELGMSSFTVYKAARSENKLNERNAFKLRKWIIEHRTKIRAALGNEAYKESVNA